MLCLECDIKDLEFGGKGQLYWLKHQLILTHHMIRFKDYAVNNLTWSGRLWIEISRGVIDAELATGAVDAQLSTALGIFAASVGNESDHRRPSPSSTSLTFISALPQVTRVRQNSIQILRSHRLHFNSIVEINPEKILSKHQLVNQYEILAISYLLILACEGGHHRLPVLSL